MEEFLNVVNQIVVNSLPLLSIGAGIAIAVALVERVGTSILNVYKKDEIKVTVYEERIKAHLESVEKAKRHLEIEEPEKPKREFVEHDGDPLEVVEFEKPKRCNSYDG